MSLRILVSGDPEKKKKLKLDMYRPLHSFIFVFLCLVGAQLIWNVFVPTI
jgi:hypothetical protein